MPLYDVILMGFPAAPRVGGTPAEAIAGVRERCAADAAVAGPAHGVEVFHVQAERGRCGQLGDDGGIHGHRDHALQRDLPGSPLQSAGQRFPASRETGTVDIIARHLTRFVCFQRWQHSWLSPEDAALWRDAANVGEAVASKCCVSSHTLEIRRATFAL
jgi:hypothetical protein